MAKRPHGEKCGCYFCTAWDQDKLHYVPKPRKKRTANRKSDVKIKHCDTCGKELAADTSTSVYCCTAGSACSTVTAICSLCEFESGWGYPFCRRCGTIFDPVPLLERVKAYVASVNADYSEDEERDETVAMIEALIKHAQTT